VNKLLEEIHPGEILLEEFMTPLGIDAERLADDIDVSLGQINDLLHGRRAISADMALRLSLYFEMEAHVWLNLQSEYDMRVANRTLKEQITPRIRVFRPAEA
jgi:addiction module HigA family antidote